MLIAMSMRIVNWQLMVSHLNHQNKTLPNLPTI